ncbi:hypothetical protein D2U88_16510 [Flagellimonas aequoris]|uniref:Uncharacterized protein n=1 Tax=Flagellimonas aequoris TaxID=2306997 RepID=A0A418N4S7_9FLAO|nr:hypothetical protein D2U88_16510 [Allomuricauda aequoris]
MVVLEIFTIIDRSKKEGLHTRAFLWDLSFHILQSIDFYKFFFFMVQPFTFVFVFSKRQGINLNHWKPTSDLRIRP